jgi:hypothetical protein
VEGPPFAIVAPRTGVWSLPLMTGRERICPFGNTARPIDPQDSVAMDWDQRTDRGVTLRGGDYRLRPRPLARELLSYTTLTSESERAFNSKSFSRSASSKGMLVDPLTP